MQVWRERKLPGLPKQKEMSYTYYNLNPAGKAVGDCVVRALSKALGQSWDQTYIDLCLEGYMRGDLPNADSIWGAYLAGRGYVRRLLPDDCPDCYTVEDFARDNPRGTFILSMPGRHVVTVVDGVVYDSWDSRNEVPVYFWTKER